MEVLDIVGLVFVGLIFVGALVVSTYVFVFFCHPLDKDFPGVWIFRGYIIIGLTFAFMLIFMIPVDFLSTYKERNLSWGFNFNMQDIWIMLCVLTLVFYFLNMTLSSYYKEKSAEGILDRIIAAVKWLGIVIVVFGAIAALVYFFLGNIVFNKKMTQKGITTFMLSEDTAATLTTNSTNRNISYSTGASFILCLMTPLVMISSIAFSIYGGMGLALYPMELIGNYLDKPSRPNAEEHVLAKKILLQTSDNLIEKAGVAYRLRREMDLTPIANPVEKKMKLQVIFEKVNELKKDLMDLDEVFQIFKLEDNIVDVNPLTYLVSLILGIVFGLFALVIILHTVLSIKGFYVILESIFLFLANLSSILSLFIFLILVIFLGIAITKGSLKLSSLLGAIFDVAPFKINQTWTDSFLLNNSVLLLSFIGMIVYFMQNCPQYFRFLASNFIFGIICNISLVNFLFRYNITSYIMILFCVLAIIMSFFSASPKALLQEKVKEKQVQLEQEKERLKEMEKQAKEGGDKPPAT